MSGYCIFKSTNQPFIDLLHEPCTCTILGGAYIASHRSLAFVRWFGAFGALGSVEIEVAQKLL
jgi:hypothetical protein